MNHLKKRLPQCVRLRQSFEVGCILSWRYYLPLRPRRELSEEEEEEPLVPLSELRRELLDEFTEPELLPRELLELLRP
jgi:hypothetical protein